MAQSGKPISEIGFDKLADRFQIVLSSDDDNGENVNKPDFREIDLGSPISPLRTHGLATATSSSSSSSGSVTWRNIPSPVSKRSDSGWNNHSGEISVESSPSNSGFKPGHARSNSSGSHPLIYSGGGSSLISPAVNVLPSGNICPTGKILNSGMASRSSKIDVLGSGTGNYGHGSIMRGGVTSKFGVRGSGSDSVVSGGAYPKGLVGGEAVKRAIWSNDPEELKRIGNEHYKKGHFAEALNLYDKAIAISPENAAYHCNRAAALIGLKRLAEAVRECEEAIRLDPRYVRAHRRLGSLFLSLGQVENARIHLCLRGKESDPAELQKLQLIDWHLSKCTDARKVGDWRSALRQVDAAIASGAFYSPQLFACKAEAHMKLHQLEDADFTLAHIPKLETYTPSFSKAKIFGMLSDAYILFVQAQVDMAHGRFENALTAAEKAVHIDPRNVELSVLINNARLVGRARVRGNDLFKSERFTEACSAYSDGLRLDPSNAVLYCNRAACWYKLRQWERSIDDCNQALRIQPKYTKAILRRAASNSKLECWADAVRDYEILRKELPSDKDVAESLFHAQVALKKSCGEEVYNMKFGGEVESVSRLEQFRSAISSPCTSVVHFKVSSNLQCKQISPFLDTLCSQYPSINFLKVDVEECPAIANDENVRIVPTFKIYRKGVRVKEMICPSREVLESSVRHYSC